MAEPRSNPWAILLEEGAVDAAARVIAAQIASPQAATEELKQVIDDYLAAPRREQPAKLASLLGAFSHIAFVAIYGFARVGGEDELDTLRFCTDATHSWRDENEPSPDA